MMLVLRTTTASSERYPLFREAIGSVDGNVPITQIRSMRDVVESSMSEPRLRTSLFAAFTLLAFVLSAVGIYGVMSYTVKERTHDIGIRMALGASFSALCSYRKGRFSTLTRRSSAPSR